MGMRGAAYAARRVMRIDGRWVSSGASGAAGKLAGKVGGKNVVQQDPEERAAADDVADLPGVPFEAGQGGVDVVDVSVQRADQGVQLRQGGPEGVSIVLLECSQF